MLPDRAAQTLSPLLSRIVCMCPRIWEAKHSVQPNSFMEKGSVLPGQKGGLNKAKQVRLNKFLTVKSRCFKEDLQHKRNTNRCLREAVPGSTREANVGRSVWRDPPRE